MGRITLTATCLLAFGICSGCGEEKPPAPDKPAVAASSGNEAGADTQAAVFVEGETAAVLSYAGERGQFADAKSAGDIPEEAKGMVRVSLLDGPRAPTGEVWIANLRDVGAGAKVTLSTVGRDMFEELALGQGRSSAFEMKLPDGIEPPDVAPAGEGVIVYKTDWCGVCKKLTAYLDKKGVSYEAKDIEKDPKAAAELRAKANAKGMKTGSVPVIDVGGELMVGFDRGRLEKML